MATQWISPTWRMPEESNQSKFENYSLYFDGSSQYIDLGSTNDLDFQTSEMSISFWINSDTASGLKAILGNSNSSSSSYQYLIDIHRTVGKISFLTSGAPTLTSNLTININTWYHVCIIKSGTTSNWVYTMYINGSSSDGGTLSTTTNPPANQTTAIGKYGALSGYYFIGKLTEVSIFDYALTDGTGGTTNQIGDLYNSGTPVNPMALTPAPVAYYDLGGSSTGEAGDNSANPVVNTLTVPNSSVPSATVFDFDGTSDFIEAANSSSLQITDNLTLSCWINVNNVTVNNNILDKFYDGTADRRSYLLRVQASRIYLYLANASGTQALWYISNSILQNNTWYHITTTFSSTGEANKQVKIYINGSLDSEHAKTDLIASNDEEFRIGSSYNTSNRFAGKISNAQVFNTALPATGSNSVETLYNYGRPLSDMSGFTSLQGWWRLSIDTSNWNGNEWLAGNSTSTYDKSLGILTNNNYINFGDTFFDSYREAGEDYPVGTISFWLKSRYTATGNFFARSFIFDQNSQWFIRFETDTKVILMVGSGVNYRGWTLSTSLTDNGWHHFALVIPSGTDKTLSKMYMDGQELSTYFTGQAGASGIHTFSRFRAGNSKWFDYSNIQFYNTALSDSDISTLYNGGVPLVEASLNPSNLKGWWKMDDTATFSTNWNIPDASGNDNPGVSSGLTEASRVNGLVSVAGKSSGMTTANLVNSDLERSIPYSSYSMDFDGLTDFIKTSSPTITSGAMSFSCWFKTSDASNNQVIWNSIDSTTAKSFLRISGTALRLKIIDGSGGNNNIDNTVTTADGNWHHIAFITDGLTTANGVVVYLDGQELAVKGTLSNAGFASTTKNQIGAYAPNAQNFNGELSNPAFFNKVLTENEIASIYNGGAPNDISSLSPVAWWSFSGDSYYNGTDWICPDLSVNSNNGDSDGTMGGDELVGSGPGSTANGLGTGMNIPGNLQGNAPNSNANAFSVNMNADDKSTSVPAVP